MNTRRISVRLAAAAGIAVGGMLVVPPPAFGGNLVLSDVIVFTVSRTAAGGLATSGCRIRSDSEPGQPLEPAAKCNVKISGYPSGSGTETVAGDPSETINFTFAVSASGAVKGTATEDEVGPNGQISRYDAIVRGTSTTVSPGVNQLKLKVLELASAP